MGVPVWDTSIADVQGGVTKPISSFPLFFLNSWSHLLANEHHIYI